VQPNHLRSHTTNIFAIAKGFASKSYAVTALAVDDVAAVNGAKANSNTLTATSPALTRALQAVGNGALGNSNTVTALAVDDVAAANGAKANSNTLTATSPALTRALQAVGNGALGNSNTVTALTVDVIDFSKTNGNTITVPAAHLPAAGDVANVRTAIPSQPLCQQHVQHELYKLSAMEPLATATQY
jgi:hypothetical protein